MPDTQQSIVANTPEAQTTTEPSNLSRRAEEMMKAELLKELSLEDIKLMISTIKSGVMTNPQDAPDSFDEYGRNFRRMVHLLEVPHNNGEGNYTIERPMAKSLVEARKENSDYFDIDAKTWILYGTKRQLDYPENTAGYMQKEGR